MLEDRILHNILHIFVRKIVQASLDSCRCDHPWSDPLPGPLPIPPDAGG